MSTRSDGSSRILTCYTPLKSGRMRQLALMGGTASIQSLRVRQVKVVQHDLKPREPPAHARLSQVDWFQFLRVLLAFPPGRRRSLDEFRKIYKVCT